MTNKRAPDYSLCWANCLGDCDGGMSQEHLVSECLFDREVNVQGFRWCKNEFKKLPIRTLTSKILCRHHNSALSEVDNAAKHTFDTLAKAYDLMEKRRNIRSRNWAVKYFRTDMLLLERWCLKTLVNINLSNKPGLPIEGNEGNSDKPVEELVKVAFGLDRFKPPMGLYRIVAKGETVDLWDGRINLVTKSWNDKLVGGEFNLWGMHFYLSLIPEPIQWEGANMMRGGMKHWFTTWDRKNRPVKSHLVTFTYPVASK